MKKIFLLLFLLTNTFIFGQILTITDTGTGYVINGTATGGSFVATEVGESTLRLRNVTEGYSNDYTTSTGFSDFSINGISPSNIEDAVERINAITGTNQVVRLSSNDMGLDAWGKPKVTIDYSLFHGMWTFSVPNRLWLQYDDTGAGFAEQGAIDNTFVKSENGALFVGGDVATDVRLSSRRHLRYQPNRGLLYSTALAIKNPNDVGINRFGLKVNGSNGVYFEHEGNGTTWTLSIIKLTTVNGVVSSISTDVTSLLPNGYDISKGHTYDIQMEWRGFGDFYFYVDLKSTHTMAMLGTLENVSISNPALSVTFEAINHASTAQGVVVGCVDVTAEGGSKENKIPDSIDTSTTLLSTSATGVGILALKIPNEILYNGNLEPYTRDLVIKKLSTFCKDEAFRSVYVGRLIDVPNLDAITWVTANDSGYLYANNVGGALDVAFQLDKGNLSNIYSIRGEKDISLEHDFSSEGSSARYMSAGDILVIELKSDGASTGGCTLEFEEEL